MMASILSYMFSSRFACYENHGPQMKKSFLGIFFYYLSVLIIIKFCMFGHQQFPHSHFQRPTPEGASFGVVPFKCLQVIQNSWPKLEGGHGLLLNFFSILRLMIVFTLCFDLWYVLWVNGWWVCFLYTTKRNLSFLRLLNFLSLTINL